MSPEELLFNLGTIALIAFLLGFGLGLELGKS
jgi:hypothetical protein